MPDLLREELHDLRVTYPEAYRLAVSLALAVRIEPALLRRQRRVLFPEFGPEVEAELWSGPFAGSRSSLFLTLRDDLRPYLLEDLSQDPATLEAAWSILEDAHGALPPSILVEEALAVQRARGGDAEAAGAEDVLRSWLKALEADPTTRMASWLARITGRLPRALQESPLLPVLKIGVASRLKATPASSEELLAAQEDWAWIVPEETSEARTKVAIRVGGGQVEFSRRPVEGEAASLEVPAGEPVVLELVDGDDRQLVVLGEDAVRHLTVKADAFEVKLPDGAVHRIHTTEAGEPLGGAVCLVEGSEGRSTGFLLDGNRVVYQGSLGTDVGALFGGLLVNGERVTEGEGRRPGLIQLYETPWETTPLEIGEGSPHPSVEVQIAGFTDRSSYPTVLTGRLSGGNAPESGGLWEVLLEPSPGNLNGLQGAPVVQNEMVIGQVVSWVRGKERDETVVQVLPASSLLESLDLHAEPSQGPLPDRAPEKALVYSLEQFEGEALVPGAARNSDAFYQGIHERPDSRELLEATVVANVQDTGEHLLRTLEDLRTRSQRYGGFQRLLFHYTGPLHFMNPKEIWLVLQPEHGEWRTGIEVSQLKRLLQDMGVFRELVFLVEGVEIPEKPWVPIQFPPEIERRLHPGEEASKGVPWMQIVQVHQDPKSWQSGLSGDSSVMTQVLIQELEKAYYSDRGPMNGEELMKSLLGAMEQAKAPIPHIQASDAYRIEFGPPIQVSPEVEPEMS